MPIQDRVIRPSSLTVGFAIRATKGWPSVERRYSTVSTNAVIISMNTPISTYAQFTIRRRYMCCLTRGLRAYS